MNKKPKFQEFLINQLLYNPLKLFRKYLNSLVENYRNKVSHLKNNKYNLSKAKQINRKKYYQEKNVIVLMQANWFKFSEK